MIRRGLQILVLVGITALGAAPSFAQVGTTNFPTWVTLQDFTNNAVNGSYSVVGTTTPDGWYVLQRFAANNSPSYWVTIADDARSGLNHLIRVHTNYPTTSETGLFYVLSRNLTPYPASVTASDWQRYSGSTVVGSVFGTIVFGWGTPPSPDPYAQNFPDWESAAVKIPLGFTFAMSFWAVAVAAAIAMRWVKDLASAAT